MAAAQCSTLARCARDSSCLTHAASAFSRFLPHAFAARVVGGPTADHLTVDQSPLTPGVVAVADAENIKAILSDKKEESELTMCTDVDRNDKSRICHAGSVQVIGRRQIEMYSRLIHTVDHVEGYLRDGFDAMDAFLCHTWAVTVTGAPKTWAIQARSLLSYIVMPTPVVASVRTLASTHPACARQPAVLASLLWTAA